MRTPVPLVLGIAIGLAITVLMGARNSSGTHSLVAGHPVVSGTTINSTVFNNQMSDFSTEITDSLSRSGKGPMLAPLECVAGSVSAPGLTFDGDENTGIYRIGADNLGVAVGGVKRLDVLPSRTHINTTLTVDGGGAALSLTPAGEDHVYLEFYADSAALSTRSGYIGYPAAGVTDLTALNAMANGDIVLTPGSGGGVRLGASNPSSSTAFTNELTPTSIIKAHGNLTTSAGASVTVNGGFNVTSASCGSSIVTVTMASAMANTNYTVLTVPLDGKYAVVPSATSTTQFTLTAQDSVPSAFNLCSGAYRLNFAVLGAQ